jgi:uncharacterized protein
MKILVVSDHEERQLYEHFEPERWVGKVDLAISCGDLRSDYLSYLVTVLGVPLLYVAGNHDGRYHTYPPEGCDDIDGKLVRIGGLRIGGLSGSLRYNSGAENFQYTNWEMRRKVWHLTRSVLRRGGVDLIVSHASPHRCPLTPNVCKTPAGVGFDCIHPELKGHPEVCPEATDACHRAVTAYDVAIRRWKPRWWIHGHNHIEYGHVPRLWWVGSSQVINADGHIVLDTDHEIDAIWGSLVIRR